MKVPAQPPEDKDGADTPASLRRLAEERLKEVQEKGSALTDNDQKKLVHELRVHQIELEMQNEELQRTKRESEELAEKYIDLYDFAPVGYFTIDPGGTIVSVNLTGSALLGRDRRSLIGARLGAFLQPESVPAFNAFCEQVLFSGKKEMCDVELPGAQGQLPWFAHFEGRAESGYGAGAGRIRLVLTDISERKRGERALRQANHQISLLSSVTRHDILNQVLVLNAYIAFSEMDLDDKEALTGFLKKEKAVAAAIEHLIRFTKEYQDLGHGEPQWQSPEKILDHLASQLSIPLEMDLHGLEIYADPMLEKVFFNLLDNAIRHGEHVTEIQVSSHQSGGALTLLLEDNGIGIAQGEHEQIFGQGFGKNTGFGLFFVREILTLTDITIQETGEPGKGARFEIMVPKGAYRFTESK
jgi:PAS domain S-box-containing protein